MFPLSPPGNPVAPASKARGVALAGFTAAAPVEAPGGGPFYTLDECGFFHACHSAFRLIPTRLKEAA